MADEPKNRIFLFYFHGKVKVVRATDGSKALDIVEERYRFDRGMLRSAMHEMAPEDTLLGGGVRNDPGFLFDQDEWDKLEAET